MAKIVREGEMIGEMRLPPGHGHGHGVDCGRRTDEGGSGDHGQHPGKSSLKPIEFDMPTFWVWSDSVWIRSALIEMFLIDFFLFN